MRKYYITLLTAGIGLMVGGFVWLMVSTLGIYDLAGECLAQDCVRQDAELARAQLHINLSRLACGLGLAATIVGVVLFRKVERKSENAKIAAPKSLY